jgi:GT2 family glycosyltransferase
MRGLGRLLDSLQAQSYRQFEVVIVDQNEGETLHPLLARHAASLSITHVRCARGLSRARNIGIEAARAPLLGFPDDDCWYRPDFLERVHAAFHDAPDLTGLTGLCLDEVGRLAAGGGCQKVRQIKKSNVWGLGVSATMFLRRQAVREVGGFDESLGLGASTPYQSGEETDLLLRLLARGHQLRYDPGLVVHHPIAEIDSQAPLKAWRYGVGMGYVLGLNAYRTREVLEHLLRPTLGSALALSSGQFALARVRWARARGRLRGWLSFKSARVSRTFNRSDPATAASFDVLIESPRLARQDDQSQTMFSQPSERPKATFQ